MKPATLNFKVKFVEYLPNPKSPLFRYFVLKRIPGPMILPIIEIVLIQHLILPIPRRILHLEPRSAGLRHESRRIAFICPCRLGVLVFHLL